MTGKSLVPRHLNETISVGVGFHAIKELFATVARGEPENAKLLLGARRSVEPRHPAAIAFEGLPDADPKARDLIHEIIAMPSEAKVVGFVQRIEVAMRRWKDRD